jgi:hypothetical protein
MYNSRKSVQARGSLLAIMIIFSGIIVETAYTAGPRWYWLLLLNIPAIIFFPGKSISDSRKIKSDLKKIKQVEWLQ